MQTADCIERDELRAFSLGCVDDDRFDTIQTHLVDCPVCEDTVASFDDTADSLIASVRIAAQNEDVAQQAEGAAESAVLKNVLARVATQASGSYDESDAASPPCVVERIRDYELVEQLGAGGMGTVYRAMHTRLEREVALKLLPARRLRDAAAVARFEREMKAIGRLDHPAIVRATDAGVVDGTHFLAMDYVEGIDVSRLVRLNGPLDVASACEIIRQAAFGLQYAHEQGLIHRDVKPSNLMLNRQGEVRILDLGLALFGAASEAVDELTTVGQLMGTLDYMAPEQCDNSHDVDSRADVYSMGATLFKLLSGNAPYDSEGQRTPLAKMKAIATIDAPSLADRSEGLPVELIEVVDRSLSRDSDDRFASASDMAAAIEPFCVEHQLAELAQRGIELAAEADVEPDLPATIPPFVRRAEPGKVVAEPGDADLAPSDAAAQPQSGSRSGRATLVRWLMLPIVLAAGVVFWIKTDTGTLHIECADDNIPIEIRRGKELVRKETLTVGKNELTIYSGRYEIVLPKEYDSLKVEDGSIELTRGGNDYVRITRLEKGAAPPTQEVSAGGDAAGAVLSTVTVPVELFGEAALAVVGDKAHVHLPHERQEAGDLTLRTIVENAVVTRIENVAESVDGTKWCDMTLQVPPSDVERLRTSAESAGALFLTVRTNMKPGREPSGIIPPGMRLVLADAYEPLGLSRMTSTGDLVDLMVTFKPRGNDEMQTMPAVQSAEVFSAQRSEFGPGEKVEIVPPIRIAVILTPADAERLLVARRAGRLEVRQVSQPAGLRPARQMFDGSYLDPEVLEQIARRRRDPNANPFIKPGRMQATTIEPASAIPPGTTTATVPIQLTGESMFALPGDRVNVHLIQDQAGGDKITRTIAQDIEIDRVQQTFRTNRSLFATMIFQVPPNIAEQLSAASALGTLVLTVESKAVVNQTASANTPAGMRIVPADANEPVFSGKTFDEWKREVLTERNPERLRSAVDALCILGRGFRDREAAETVLQILAPYPLDALLDGTGAASRGILSPDENLVLAAIRQLRGLKPAEVIEPIIGSLAKDSPLLRRLVILWLAEPHRTLRTPTTVGKPDPLRQTLHDSPEYINAVLDHWDEFDDATRSAAFWTVSDVALRAGDNQKLIARLDEIVSDEGSEFQVKAALLMSRIRPRPELADVFLTKLENPVADPDGATMYGGRAVPTSELWWTRESDAWLGLANLGEHAHASVNRIAGLLTVLKKQSALDRLSTLQVTLKQNSGIMQLPASPRMLIYELLGRMGPAAESARPTILASMKDYFGIAPDQQGDFGFVAAEPRFLLDHQNVASMASTLDNYGGGGGGGFFAVIDNYGDEITRGKEVPTLYATVLNAAVLTLQRITGKPVRYADMVFRKEPAPSGPGGGGVISAMGQPVGGPQNQGIPVAWFPLLVTYRGQNFDEWRSAASTVATSDLSLEEMGHIVTGLGVMRSTDRKLERPAAAAVSHVLRHVLATQSFFATAKDVALAASGLPSAPAIPAGTPVTIEEPFSLAMSAFGSVYNFDSSLAETIAVDTIKHGTDQARWMVVYWIANPREQIANSECPMTTEYSRSLNSLAFATAFHELFDDREWQVHSPTLKRAMIQLAWRYAANVGKETNHNDLLMNSLASRLSSEKDPSRRAELAITLARYQAVGDQPLHSTAQRKVQNALVEAVTDPPAGISLVDIVMALDEVRGSSTDIFADRLVALIKADSAADADIGALRVHVPPSRQSGGAMGMAGGGMAAGYPGSGGIAGASGMAGFGAPTAQNRVVSRRLLLVQALTEMQLNAKNIREQIAAELVELIKTPVTEFFEDRTPLKHLRRSWREGTRTHSGKPADANGEAEAFKDAVVNCVLSLDFKGEAAKKLFSSTTGLQPAKKTPPRPGVYDGRNYAQWLETVRIERSPAKLAEAVRALRLLGADQHDVEVAEAILSTTRLFDVHQLGPDSPEMQFFYSADDQLRQLDIDAIVAPLVDVFRNGNAKQRSYVCVFVSSTGLDPGKQYIDQHRLLLKRLAESSEFRDAIQPVWLDKDTTPIVQTYLFSVLQTNFILGEKTHPSIVAFLKHVADASSPPATTTSPALITDPLQDYWKSEFRERRQIAAYHLSAIAPDHPTLPQLFADELVRPLESSQTWWYARKYALLGLTRLGPRAKSELPRLVKLLGERSDLKLDPETDNGLYLNDEDVPDACIVQNTRIAVAELIAVIALAEDDGELDEETVSILNGIVKQRPLPFPGFNRREEVTRDVSHVRKDGLVLPRLLKATETGESIRVDLNSPPVALTDGAGRVRDLEHLIFQKTALIVLKLAGLVETDDTPDAKPE